MKNFPIHTFMLFLSLSLAVNAFAQDSKDVAVSFENAKTKCANKPLAERVSIVVSRFDLGIANNPYELSQNLSTQLTNCLQQINCFRVLEMSKYTGDLGIELDGNEYSNEATGAETGNMQKAQLIVSGQITEFSRQDQSTMLMGVRVGKETVKLGFVLKIINPGTRDILWSQSVNVTGESASSTSIGTYIPRFGGLYLAQGTNQNRAVADALEKGVMQAAELLVESLETIELPKALPPGVNVILVNLENDNYGGMMGMETKLKAVPGISLVQSTFKNGVGSLRVQYKGDSEALMKALYAKVSATYEVQDVVPGKIVLKHN